MLVNERATTVAIVTGAAAWIAAPLSFHTSSPLWIAAAGAVAAIGGRSVARHVRQPASEWAIHVVAAGAVCAALVAAAVLVWRVAGAGPLAALVGTALILGGGWFASALLPRSSVGEIAVGAWLVTTSVPAAIAFEVLPLLSTLAFGVVALPVAFIVGIGAAVRRALLPDPAPPPPQLPEARLRG